MIIGISGKKQHGKDTICKIIQYLLFIESDKEEHSKYYPLEGFVYNLKLNHPDTIKEGLETTWQRKLFADKLKDIVCILIGCTREQLEDNNFKEKELGEEWRVWYWSHYRLPTINNPFQRLGALYLTEEEAKVEQRRWSPNFEDGQIKSYLLTPRLLLQLIGTECGRKIIHPNIWVNALMSEYKPTDIPPYIKKQANTIRGADGMFYVPERPNIPKEHWSKQVDSDRVEWYEQITEPVFPNWIITDVRFPNEVKAIKDRGGIILRVNRNIIPNLERALTGRNSQKGLSSIKLKQDNHPSETSLDNYKEFDYIVNNDGTIEDLVQNIKSVLQKCKII